MCWQFTDSDGFTRFVASYFQDHDITGSIKLRHGPTGLFGSKCGNLIAIDDHDLATYLKTKVGCMGSTQVYRVYMY